MCAQGSAILLQMGKLRQGTTKMLVQDQLHSRWKDRGSGLQTSGLRILPLSPYNLPEDGTEKDKSTPK